MIDRRCIIRVPTGFSTFLNFTPNSDWKKSFLDTSFLSRISSSLVLTNAERTAAFGRGTLENGESVRIEITGNNLKSTSNIVSSGTITGIVVKDARGTVTAELSNVTLSADEFNRPMLATSTRIFGGNDIIYGRNGPDVFAASDKLRGFSGDDRIYGLDGNDTIRGDDGNDILSGGTGYDWLYGDAGNDTSLLTVGDSDRAFGGAGVDTANFSASTKGLVKLSLENNAFLKEIENVVGTKFNESIYGTTGNNVVDGLDGNDSLYGGGGNDVLIGGNGKDTLKGEAGNDRLQGDLGADALDGGAGNDVFVFLRTLDSTPTATASTGRDEIRGFDTRYDQIDLRAIDANTKVAGD
ncbi:MAG: hypothetical protein U1E59_11890 [Amaricoccus sp.]